MSDFLKKASKSQSSEQKADQKRLNLDFYQNYDPSSLLQFARKIKQNEISIKTQHFCGEGSHFSVWRYGSPKQQYVLKIPHPFEREIEKYKFEHWIKKMKKLSTLSLILIPPFEFLKFEDDTVMVMPFGEDSLDLIHGYWKPIEEQVAKFQSGLESSKLWVNDEIQLKQSNGTPFICDFSDLESF